MAKKFVWENVSTTLATGRDWDPLTHADNVPTQQCLLRIKRFVNNIFKHLKKITRVHLDTHHFSRDIYVIENKSIKCFKIILINTKSCSILLNLLLKTYF